MPIAVEAQQTVSPLAGRPAAAAMLIDLARLEREYFERVPDLDDPDQMVRFGTSGHRGSPLRGSFTESHILAITQAICDFRRRVQGTDGPLYMGKDTHALSAPAQHTALQVLAANGVETVIQQDDGVTPAPVISRAILVHNRDRKNGLADGIVITAVTQPAGGRRLQVQSAERRPRRYERHSLGGGQGQRTAPQAQRGRQTRADHDGSAGRHNASRRLRPARMCGICSNVVDMDAIRAAGLKLAVDPLGGAARPYWEPINSVYGLDIAIVNPVIDPTFSFMTVDHDGEIRMDCSSPYAMARLVN